DHPEIRAQVARLVRKDAEPWENAVAIHDFVRDEIEYGFGPRFYEHKASEVLSQGRGFCNSKSTLFVAMLRAAGIHARQRFVEIEPPILYGIVNPGTPWLDHSFTEVWLEGNWVAVDSYNVDPELNRGARIRLQRERKVQGYGVHSSGTIRWDGKTNSFSQFVSGLEQPSFSSRDMGIHEDVFQFYESGSYGWNPMEPGMRTFFPIAAVIMNRKLDRVRKTGLGIFERRELMSSAGFRRFRSKP
ncbi:MAG: transglutaminase-like domain-containing protein, partial [Verrucomicrobiota bacterium]